MSLLTITTRRYKDALVAFIKTHPQCELVKEWEENGCFNARIKKHVPIYEELLTFLCTILFEQNAAMQSSPKVKEIVMNHANKDEKYKLLYNIHMKELKHFIASSNHLCIEGYVSFRLCELNNYFNCVLYSLVKHLSFSR